MFGFLKKIKEAKAAQKGLTEAFKIHGLNFMAMNSTVHEALVKEAIATGVQATMEHYIRVDLYSFGREGEIIEYYTVRSKQFSS